MKSLGRSLFKDTQRCHLSMANFKAMAYKTFNMSVHILYMHNLDILKGNEFLRISKTIFS